jgi:hypothetical protein
MVWFLWEEWGVFVSQPTVSRTIKRIDISRKQGERVGIRQNDELRLDWKAQMLHVTAEQLVFVDESLFNETTGWRHYAYAPIGEAARYHASRDRGASWSVLPAYTLNGYLPCTSIRESMMARAMSTRYYSIVIDIMLGWFNGDAFYEWVTESLLPLCNEYPGNNSIIIMDNVSIHCNPRITQAVEAKGCQVRYLPPYSPDFNPIELSFSVLKAWVRRHFLEIWPHFDGTFGEFLASAVARSGCDRFPEQHFRHSAGGGYIFEDDLNQLEHALEQGEQTFELE